MAYIPVPNTAQLELVYLWAGQRCQTVLHYVKASPWDITMLEEATVQIIFLFNSELKSLMPTTISLIEVRAVDLSSETGEVYNQTATLPIAGTNVSPSMPNNVALTLTKRTALRGRSYRGRIYHPGLVDAYVTGNTVNNDAVIGILGAWTQFLALTLTGDEPLMAVVSRFNNNTPRSTGVATLVTNLTSDGVVDSQRRRLPGRGS